MSKKGSLKTSLDAPLDQSMGAFEIYDVPGALLDCRGLARPMLKHSDEQVRKITQEIMDLLSKSLIAIGRNDIELLAPVDGSEMIIAGDGPVVN